MFKQSVIYLVYSLWHYQIESITKQLFNASVFRYARLSLLYMHCSLECLEDAIKLDKAMACDAGSCGLR